MGLGGGVGRPLDLRVGECWGFFESLGEVHYPLVLGGNLVSRVGLGVSRRVGGGWRPVPGLGEVFGGLAPSFLRSFYLNVMVAGEGRLVVSPDGVGGSAVEFCSVGEVSERPDGVWVRRRWEGAAEEPLVGARVVAAWRPSPRWSGRADPALVSVLTECRELEALKLGLLAKITSRLASQGLLFLPTGLSVPAVAGRGGQSSVLQYLTTVFEAAKQANGTSAAAMPILLQGPGELAEQIRHIVLDTNLSDADERHRQELRAAIAQGLELPRQTQTNDTTGVNHWGMWTINESALVDHVLPVADAAANLLTERVLWPQLRAQGKPETEVRRHRVHTDATDAALSVVRVDAARQLYDRNLIGDTAMRKAHGFPETDKPTVDEIIRGIGIKLNNPVLATWGLDAVIPPEALNMPAPPGIGGWDAPNPYTGPETISTPETGLDH